MLSKYLLILISFLAIGVQAADNIFMKSLVGKNLSSVSKDGCLVRVEPTSEDKYQVFWSAECGDSSQSPSLIKCSGGDLCFDAAKTGESQADNNKYFHNYYLNWTLYTNWASYTKRTIVFSHGKMTMHTPIAYLGKLQFYHEEFIIK